MKVSLLTPVREGGPYNWGRDLVSMLNKNDIKANQIHTLFSLSKSCLYQDADIVHTTVPIPFKLWKRPTVSTVKGDYTIERNMWQRFMPKTITQADVITTPSQYLKQKLGLEKAIVIPNALFPRKFRLAQHEARNELNLVTVMNFYFLDKVKGLLNIIGILNKVQKPMIRYTIIGGGRYLDTIKHQIGEIKLDVKFTGFLPDPKSALAASDIFLYYSYHDNFPNVILEAMACGLPVVTNNVGAVNETIENEKDGYIATTDDAYLEYLINLLSNVELRKRIGENARKTVEAKFDWAKIVDRYIEIYKKLL
jgi:glycosyltransferase involved in cell wall biosynthesis